MTIPASVKSICHNSFKGCNLLLPLSFAPPSRIRQLYLPQLSNMSQPIPDGVQRLSFWTNPDKSITSVLTFGRESKLQEICPRYGQAKLPGRAFLQLSSPSLKGLRLRLEFDK
jgi:hypothetical protein